MNKNTLEIKKILREFEFDLIKTNHKWLEDDLGEYPLLDAWNKTKEVMAQRKLQEVYNMAYEAGAINEKTLALRTKISSLKNDKPCGKFFWITIRPPHDTEFEQFKKLVLKLSKKAFIKSYMYVYEQTASERNERELGHGFHIHLLFEKTEDAEAPSKLKKYIRNGFKNIMDVNNEACFKIIIAPEKYLDDKIDYMLDKNLDDDHKDKEEKQEFDKKWRQKEHLEEYYIEGEDGVLYQKLKDLVPTENHTY